MMKKLFTFLIVTLSVFQGFSQTPQYTFTNGTGGNAIPLGGIAWQDQRSQFLYFPGDFGTSVPTNMAITKIYFRAWSSSPQTGTYSDFKVSLGQKSITTLSTTWETGLATVLNVPSFSAGPVSSNQWIEIELDNPFPYDPNMPLIVETYQTATVGGITLLAGGSPVNPIHATAHTQNYGPTSAANANASRHYSYQFGFDLISLLPDNAGMVSIDSPSVFCAGLHDVYATIRNFGTNQIDSIEVHWEFNGVPQPTIFFNQIIDTLNGTLPNFYQINLGAANFGAGRDTVKVYTSLPNGVPDTVNGNDTLIFIFETAAPPTGLSFQNITMTTADAIISGGTGAYEFEYGPSGFTLGTGTTGSTSTNTFSISGLSHSTLYDVYVRSDCGAGDVSAYIGPFSFWTAFATPFYQNFENFGSNFSGIHDIEGWNSIAIIDPQWESGMSTSSLNTGPDQDHTIGSGGTFLYLETSGGSLGDFDTLMSPPIYIDSNISGLTVEFWYHMYGATMGSLEIYIDTNGVTQAIDTIIGQQHAAGTDPWTFYTAHFSGYEGSTVQLIFKGVRGSSFESDMAIDDVRLMETPTCIRPYPLTADNITTDSADLSWIENNLATQWEIEFDIAGFTLGTGSRSRVTSNPFTYTGLSANTEYEYYVRSVCGRGDSSLWSGPFKFVTPCTEISTFPYLEDFDGTTVNDVWNCWSVYNIDGGDTWVQDNIYITAHSGLYTAHGMGNNNDMLISPQFDLPTTPMWLKLYDVVESATYNNTYSVLVSTTGRDTSDFTDTLATYNVTNTSWVERTIDLSAYTNQQIYIALWQSFSGATFYGFGVDDFLIQEIPSCIKPDNLSISNLTSDSVVLSWTEINAATQWEVQYGTAGFIIGNGNTVTANSNPFTLNTVNPNTIYEFYVRSICGRGDTSYWEGPYLFETPCLPFTAPYARDFESDISGLEPDCWSSLNTVQFAEVYVNSFTGTAAPHNGTKALYLYGYNGTPGIDHVNAISPAFSDLTAFDKQIRFFANSDDPNTGLIIGTMPSPIDTALMHPLDTIYFSQADTYEEVIFLFDAASGYNGTDQYIYLEHSLGGLYYYVRIDDFHYETIPTCKKPNLLSATNIGPTSALLNWNEKNVATVWEIEYSTAGTSFGAGTRDTVASNPYNLTALSPSTIYQYFVRSICGRGDSSYWSGPYIFETPCFPMQAPFYEDFEGGSLPACWQQGTSNSENWIFATTGGHVGNGGTIAGSTTSGGFFAYVDDSTPDNLGTILETPLVDVSAYTNPTLEFYRISNNEGQTNVNFSVEVWDGSTWNQVYTTNTNSLNSAWELVIIQLNTLTITGPVKARFIVDENNPAGHFYDDVAIDDVYIGERMPYDAGVTDITSPSTPVGPNCGLTATETVTVNLQNFGTNLLDSVDLAYTIDGGSAVVERFHNLGLALGEDTSLTFAATANLSSGIGFEIQAYSILPLDVIFINDTSTKSDIGGYKAPFMEDFETLADFETGTMTNGWVSSSTAAPNWVSEVSSGTDMNSASTGADFDHTLYGVPGGVYVFMETSGGSLGSESTLTSPCIDISNTVIPGVEFYYHMYGADMGKLFVDIYDGSNWVAIDSIIGQQHISGSESWSKKVINLTCLNITLPNVLKLRFRGQRGNSFTSDMSVDDVSIIDMNGYNDMSADQLDIVGVDYHSVPIAHANFSFEGSVSNVGANTMDSVAVSVSSGTFSSSDTILSAPSCGFDSTIAFSGAFIPQSAGLKQISLNVSAKQADSDLSNNTLNKYVIVSDTVYAKTDSSVTGGIGSNTDPLEMGQVYTLLATDTLTSVSYYLNSPTVGDSIRFNLYSFSSGVPGNLITSSDYILAPAAGWHTINMGCDTILGAGQYLLVVEQVEPLNNIGFGYNYNYFEPNTAFYRYYNTASNWTLFENGGFPISLLLQANFGTCPLITNIEEEKDQFTNISIQPNPSKGIFNIIGDNVKEEVEISLYNSNGKLVYQSSDKLSNNFEERIDISGLAKGLYFVKLQSNNAMETMKVVIQ